MISMQNYLSISKLFEIFKSDQLWLLNNPTNAASSQVQVPQKYNYIIEWSLITLGVTVKLKMNKQFQICLFFILISMIVCHRIVYDTVLFTWKNSATSNVCMDCCMIISKAKTSLNCTFSNCRALCVVQVPDSHQFFTANKMWQYLPDLHDPKHFPILEYQFPISFQFA